MNKKAKGGMRPKRAKKARLVKEAQVATGSGPMHDPQSENRGRSRGR